MSFRRSFCIAALVSLGSGALALFFPRSFAPPSAGPGYEVLTLDASYPDRLIGERLAGAGVEAFISESTQWVFLDDFGELIRVPLDSAGDRLEPFDPRNDGYAGRLRSFFVREGKRRFFIPLSGASPELPRGLEKRLEAALGDIPFSAEFLGSSGPSRLPLGLPARLVLFALAAAGALFFSGGLFPGVFLLPLTAAFSLGAPSGFALSAVLTALFHALGGPLREWFTARRCGGKPPSPLRPGGTGKKPVLSVLVILGLSAAYALIARRALPPLPGLAGALAFCAVLGTAFWAEANRGSEAGHIRFVPVPIRDPGIRAFLSSWAVLPFGLAAVLSLVLPRVLDGGLAVSAPAGEVGVAGDYLGMREDYENHLAFQSSFSFRPLGNSLGDSPGAGYVRYHLDPEGLIVEDADTPRGVNAGGPAGEGAFPLEELLAFLGTYQNPGTFAYTGGEIASALTALLLGLPALFRPGRRRRKKGSLYMYSDKRVAA
jgi:hypothetical protein